MTEIDYAEYANTGSPSDQQLILTSEAQWPDYMLIPGLAIVVPPQSGRYDVVGFLSLAQSNYYTSSFLLRIVELGGPTQVVRASLQTIPQVFGSPPDQNDQQTFGPFSIRARFAANGTTKKYGLFASRYTAGTPTNPDWTLLLDDAGPNVAYICADTA